MKKIFLLLFALLGITSFSYSQQQALSKIGSPDILWNQNIADKLVGNNYVSTIKKSPITIAKTKRTIVGVSFRNLVHNIHSV